MAPNSPIALRRSEPLAVFVLAIWATESLDMGRASRAL
jgi:hypothetical protein